MDYQKFYAEVVEWINQSNQMATKYGFENMAFWDWATESIGKISAKYGNNKFVIKQMAMLYEWLDDVYGEMNGRR